MAGQYITFIFHYSFVLNCRGVTLQFLEFFTPIAYYNDPLFCQNVKVRPTPYFITNPAILGFSKFLRKQKSFSTTQNSFWEQKIIYIFTNCRRASFQKTGNLQILYQYINLPPTPVSTTTGQFRFFQLYQKSLKRLCIGKSWNLSSKISCCLPFNLDLGLSFQRSWQ